MGDLQPKLQTRIKRHHAALVAIDENTDGTQVGWQAAVACEHEGASCFERWPKLGTRGRRHAVLGRVNVEQGAAAHESEVDLRQRARPAECREND